MRKTQNPKGKGKKVTSLPNGSKINLKNVRKTNKAMDKGFISKWFW